jgi:hypothetical protein
MNHSEMTPSICWERARVETVRIRSDAAIPNDVRDPRNGVAIELDPIELPSRAWALARPDDQVATVMTVGKATDLLSHLAGRRRALGLPQERFRASVAEKGLQVL